MKPIVMKAAEDICGKIIANVKKNRG